MTRVTGRDPGRAWRGPRPAVLVALAILATGCRYTVDLDPPEPAATSSAIVASDGSVVTELDTGERRTPVTLDEIAPVLRDAIVAIEDHRFWEHSGVDTRAIARALRENASEGEITQGGSTITQQYVRLVMLGRERTVSRKVREAVLAMQVEQRLSKEEILERYLNTVYFGAGAYGAQAAADRFFGKPASDLTLPEAAMLAGVVHAPSTYDPRTDPDRVVARRNVVLDKMAEYGFASTADVAAAKRSVIALADDRGDDYLAPHFVEQVQRFVRSRDEFGETVEERERLLFQGGLRIETTLDPRLQLLAEDAVATVLLDPARDPSAAVVAIDPATGHVLAYVGGHDFFGDSPTAKFDLASQARRQAGSAFKPFVLAQALAEDIPLDREYDAPSEIEIPLPGQPPWVVHNYDGEGEGSMDLVDATVASVNTVYAQLVMDVGPPDVVDLAARMGVRSRLDPYPSAALGTNGVSALDLASAYTTFAGDGLHAEPVFVTRVTDPGGTVLYEAPVARERVLDANVTRVVNGVLQQVVTRGTGVNARIGRAVAGKTGTGENWADAWFVGSTPELTAAVWVGFPDGERPMVPPATRLQVTGGSWPAQIWSLFVGSALAETPASEFPVPERTGGPVVEPRALPDVTGMPADDARELLEDAGFFVLVEQVPDGEFPPGTVLDQRPLGGTQVTPGAPVTLWTARRVRHVVVPQVLGLLADEAIPFLEAEGLEVELVTEAEPPPGAPDRRGRIWKQTPIAGERVDEGTTVTIWVNP